MPNSSRQTIAALSCLIVLQLIMLSALYAGVPPHPPVATPLFGIAPFLGASISAALVAIILGPLDSKIARGIAGLAVVFALVSFGPQKYLDAQFPLTWPAVITAQIAAIITVFQIATANDQTASVQTRH